MPSSISTINSFSTVLANAPGFRGFPSEQYVTAGVGVSATAVLPKVDGYPCTFSVVQEGGTAATCRQGTMTIFNATLCAVTGLGLAAGGPGADQLGVTAAAGVITLASSATHSGGSKPIYINRIA